MQVAICIGRTVVVNDNVDTLNINPSAENVSRNQYAFLKRLERSVTIYTGTNPSVSATGHREQNEFHTVPLVADRSEC